MTEAPTDIEMIVLGAFREGIELARQRLEKQLRQVDELIKPENNLSKPAQEYFTRESGLTLTALKQFRSFAVQFEKDYMEKHWASVRAVRPQKNAPTTDAPVA